MGLLLRVLGVINTETLGSRQCLIKANHVEAVVKEIGPHVSDSKYAAVRVAAVEVVVQLFKRTDGSVWFMSCLGSDF